MMLRTTESRVAALEKKIADMEGGSTEETVKVEVEQVRSVRHKVLTLVMRILHWITGKRRK